MRATINGIELKIQFRHEEGAFVRREYLGRGKKVQAIEDLIKLQEITQFQIEAGDPRPELLKSVGLLAELLQQELQKTTKLPIIAPRRTVCTILQTHGDHEHEISRGEAYVSPLDQFNKETGRQIALARALEPLIPEAQATLLTAYVLRHRENIRRGMRERGWREEHD